MNPKKTKDVLLALGVCAAAALPLSRLRHWEAKQLSRLSPGQMYGFVFGSLALGVIAAAVQDQLLETPKPEPTEVHQPLWSYGLIVPGADSEVVEACYEPEVLTQIEADQYRYRNHRLHLYHPTKRWHVRTHDYVLLPGQVGADQQDGFPTVAAAIAWLNTALPV